MLQAISIESKVLIAICLTDMLSTLAFIATGLAIEQNPLMAACIRHSAFTFVAVKIASFLPFVLVVEYYRTRNAAFARNAVRAAIVLYVLVYVGLTLRVNIA